MRFTLLLCLLTTSLAQAQQSSTSSQPPASASSESSSSATPKRDTRNVIELASQKVTIPAAQIPLTTLDGKDVKLGDYDAKVVVVSLWGTINRDNSMLQFLEKLRQAYKGNKDVAIIAVNADLPRDQDDVQVIRDITKEMGATYPMLIDKDLKLLAYVNQQLRPSEMERNTFVIPNFLLFSKKFEKMEQPAFPKTDKDDEFLQWMRKEVDQVRLRKK